MLCSFPATSSPPAPLHHGMDPSINTTELPQDSGDVPLISGSASKKSIPEKDAAIETVKPLRELPSERATARVQGLRRRNNVTISTRHLLINFSPSQPKDDEDEVQQRHALWRRRKRAAQASIKRLKAPPLLSRLEGVVASLYRSQTLKYRFNRAELDARNAVQFYFPSRASVPVYIVDFYANRAVRHVRPLRDLDNCMAATAVFTSSHLDTQNRR